MLKEEIKQLRSEVAANQSELSGLHLCAIVGSIVIVRMYANVCS